VRATNRLLYNYQLSTINYQLSTDNLVILAMSALPVNQAKSNLEQLIDDVAQSHQPVLIKGDRSNAILIAEEDWSAIQETLYLLSIPGMGESIKSGLETPIEEWSLATL